ncbi:MAG: hypothetical protein MZV49_19070 [Rhodopseudomonas palustris]|nr:hypothetical protein [Rhodopseudomonas palustris]
MPGDLGIALDGVFDAALVLSVEPAGGVPGQQRFDGSRFLLPDFLLVAIMASLALRRLL